MTECKLKFPCDCVSGSESCEEPWVRVAKNGMFKNGTKEEIINRLHFQPQTIAQYSKENDLAQPTVHRHMNDLARNGLIRETTDVEKGYTAEKYYELSFPVISRTDKILCHAEIQRLAEDMASLIKNRLSSIKSTYPSTQCSGKGWRFEEIAQYILFTAQRAARQKLEAEGILADSLAGSSLDFIFWAEEENLAEDKE